MHKHPKQNQSYREPFRGSCGWWATPCPWRTRSSSRHRPLAPAFSGEGYFVQDLFSFSFFSFGFLAFRLLGFLASWLFGFLASRLLGFSASCWFMRLSVAFWLWLFASSAFPVLLWQVAFWLLRLFTGLCGLWRLWLFASFAFPVPLRAFLGFAPFHWILDLASRNISITF